MQAETQGLIASCRDPSLYAAAECLPLPQCVSQNAFACCIDTCSGAFDARCTTFDCAIHVAQHSGKEDGGLIARDGVSGMDFCNNPFVSARIAHPAGSADSADTHRITHSFTTVTWFVKKLYVCINCQRHPASSSAISMRASWYNVTALSQICDNVVTTSSKTQ